MNFGNVITNAWLFLLSAGTGRIIINQDMGKAIRKRLI